MARACKKCGNEEDYNFVLNIGLCNPCIGEGLEQLDELQAELMAWQGKAEEYHDQYHLCEAKLLSHKSIIKHLQADNDKLLDIIRRYHLHCGTNNQICGLNLEAEKAMKGEEL